jgi:quercetin dioxygenase-like cupin family protein
MTNNSEKKTIPVQAYWTSVEGRPLEAAADLPRRIVVRSIDSPSGSYVPMHSHAWGQLLFLTEGLVEARANNAGSWIVPPQRAVWLPSSIEHEIKIIHSVKMRNVYIAPEASHHLPATCQVMNVSYLLRELIIALAGLDPLYDEDGPDGRLVAVFLDQLHLSEAAPLHLPMPSSKALRIIAATIVDKPEHHYSMH